MSLAAAPAAVAKDQWYGHATASALPVTKYAEAVGSPHLQFQLHPLIHDWQRVPPPSMISFPGSACTASAASQPAASAICPSHRQLMQAAVQFPGQTAYASTASYVATLDNFRQRQVWHSEMVPVPESNYGVVITAEMPALSHHIGRQVVLNDDAIRNHDWQHQGAWMRTTAEPRQEAHRKRQPESTWLRETADCSTAVDMKGALVQVSHHERHNALYDKMARVRNRLAEGDHVRETVAKVNAGMKRQLINPDEISEFFSNPMAIAYDTIN